MENYQQKINDLLRKARAQGVTNIVVAPKEEEKSLKSLKEIWRDSTPTTRFHKTEKSAKGKKLKAKSSGNKNNRADRQQYRTNMENIPVQPFVGFRRNKASTLLEKCKDMPSQSTRMYISPQADYPRNSNSSPHESVKDSAILRMGIKTGYSPDVVRPDISSMDFPGNSNLIITSDGNNDVSMTSAASTPERQIMMLPESDEEMEDSSPEIMSIKNDKTSVFKVAKNATTTHVRTQKSDHRITPPNRNASVVGYFQKGKRQQRSTELVTSEKLNDISPDTLRILAAAQSNGEFGLEEYKMPNPFIVKTFIG